MWDHKLCTAVVSSRESLCHKVYPPLRSLFASHQPQPDSGSLTASLAPRSPLADAVPILVKFFARLPISLEHLG